MRAKNTPNDLELYAITGTHAAVISMDFKQKPQQLLGFSFERKDLKTGFRTWLEGQKCFKSLIPDPVPGQKYPSYLHPIQSFMWKDFTLDPGEAYEFTVTPLFGNPANPTHGERVSLVVKTEKQNIDGHRIYFNQGVAGSQFYARVFGNAKPSEMEEGEKTRAFRWLSRGLHEAFVDFIDVANPGQHLRGAFYEFIHRESLEALKAAHLRGVDVKIVYSGKSYKSKNEAMIAELGIGFLCQFKRDNEVNIPHNKFLLHCGINGQPLKVWTGSTNLSEKAFFGHCNTGHVIESRGIARQFLNYWNALATNPLRDDLRDLNHQEQDDEDIANLPDGTTVFFCPRRNAEMLDKLADLVKRAGEMVCCIYPFNIDERFETVFQIDKPFIRYILLDKRTDNNTFETNDKDVEVAAGAYVKSPVDQWINETSAGSLIHGGVNYLHNKIILIDPLSEHPVVVSGSSNYSEPSIRYNDENILVVKSDIPVADIYFTEFVRLFDHFSFREWLNTDPGEFKPFLDETYFWVNKYFDNPEFRSFKRKMSFKNMFIPS